MRYTKEDIKTMINEYVSGTSTTKIAEKYKFNKYSVINLLKKNGVNIRANIESQKRHPVDFLFFEKINSHDKAQILGFIYADGCIAVRGKNSRRLQIYINSEDSHYLHFINDRIKNACPIVNKTYHCKDGIIRKVSKLNCSHPKIIKDLEKLGVTPRKSLAIDFPSEKQVPKEFIFSFILGVFEGDGCIYIPINTKRKSATVTVQIAASVPFNEKLKKILKENGIESYIVVKKTKLGKNISILFLYTIGGIKKFFYLIYSHCTYKMQRKYNKFQEFLNKYDENMKLKVKPSRNTFVGGYFKSPNNLIYKFNTWTDFCNEMKIKSHCWYEALRSPKKTSLGWSIPTSVEISIARANSTLIEKIYRIPVVSS